VRANYSAAYQRLLGRLRQARREAALTQADVGRRLEVRLAFISKVESGERRIAPVELAQFAAVYTSLWCGALARLKVTTLTVRASQNQPGSRRGSFAVGAAGRPVTQRPASPCRLRNLLYHRPPDGEAHGTSCRPRSPMIEIDLHDAQGKLEQLIEEAAAGNEVVITCASGAAVRLVVVSNDTSEVPKTPSQPIGHGLDRFIGTWSAEQAAEVLREIEVFEQVDESFWT
jgi:antitoxin (DNA-binding transcriptional repressor) of toxin-antitoxin stability system/DNA-binding XRE family transcriptional regulator